MEDSLAFNRRTRYVSIAGALGMHLLFIAFLVIGVSWHHRYEAPSNTVDLWAQLPQPHAASQPAAQPAVEPPPPPAPEPPPQPVRPQPQPKPQPQPHVVTPPKLTVVSPPKPDIALKEKADKLKEEKQKADKQKADKQKADKEKADKEKAEQAKAEQQRRAAEEKQQDAKKQEQSRLAKEQAALNQRVQAQQQAAQKASADAAGAQSKLRNEYIARIQNKIKSLIVLPPNMEGNPQAEFYVVLIPGGSVMTAKLTHSSGNAAYDSAVERAINKADPLPLPPDPTLFSVFRELNLKFRPQE